MVGRHVRDLVTHHGRQLMLVLCNVQDAREDHDLAARENEGIDRRVIDDSQLPIHVCIGTFQGIHDRVGHAGNVVDGRPILDESRRFADLLELLCANGLELHLRGAPGGQHGSGRSSGKPFHCTRRNRVRHVCVPHFVSTRQPRPETAAETGCGTSFIPQTASPDPGSRFSGAGVIRTCAASAIRP